MTVPHSLEEGKKITYISLSASLFIRDLSQRLIDSGESYDEKCLPL